MCCGGRVLREEFRARALFLGGGQDDFGVLRVTGACQALATRPRGGVQKDKRLWCRQGQRADASPYLVQGGDWTPAASWRLACRVLDQDGEAAQNKHRML